MGICLRWFVSVCISMIFSTTQSFEKKKKKYLSPIRTIVLNEKIFKTTLGCTSKPDLQCFVEYTDRLPLHGHPVCMFVIYCVVLMEHGEVQTH